MDVSFTHTQRITAGYLAVIALMFLVTFLGSSAIQNGEAALDKVINIDARKTREVAEIVQGLISLQRAEKNLILATTQGQMDEYERAINDTATHIDNLANSVRELVDHDGSTLLSQFQTEYASFREAQKQVITLTRENANYRARELSQGEARDSHNRATSAIKKVIAFSNDQIELQVEALTTATGTAREKAAQHLLRSNEKARLAAKISDTLSDMQRDEKNVILSRDPQEMEAYALTLAGNRSKLDAQLAELSSLISRSYRAVGATQTTRDNIAREEQAVNEFSNAYRQYRSYQNSVLELTRLNSNVKALEISTNRGRTAFDQAERVLEKLADKVDEDMSTSLEALKTSSTNYRFLTVSIALLAVVLSSAVAFLVIRSLKRRTQQLTDRATQISQGSLTSSSTAVANDELQGLELALTRIQDAFREIMTLSDQFSVGNLEGRLTPRSEDDALVRAINRMADNTDEVVRVASKVAQGDLSTEILIRSNDDQLGQALQGMVAGLRHSEESNRRRAWIDAGIALINERVLGEPDVNTLASTTIEALCKHVGAQVGALYLAEGSEGASTHDSQVELILIGSYAYTERKQLSNRYRLGESLVGQAALEKQAILVSDVPTDYVRVTSGLGETTPAHILVVPFLHEGQLLGVIELGTVSEFTDAASTLIQRASEIIAAAFNSAARSSALDQALKDSQALTEELRVQQENLESANAELEEQTQALEVSQQEITARNHKLMLAQDELNERAEQLRQSNKYKSEFLANMSHELRTPLNSILLLSKMMASGVVEEGDEQRTNAQVIYDAGTDLLNLINEVLDLAKIEAGKMRVKYSQVDVDTFIQSYRPLFEPQAADKNLLFETNVAPNTAEHFTSDTERVQQILRNFLSNAFKFTEQGSVQLVASPIDDAITSGLITYGNIRDSLQSNPQDYIAFSVIDSGVGIDESKRQLVFEAFQQLDGSTSRQHGGTGLGLSISNQLAEMLGGAVGLQSRPGQGSKFSLVLPIVPPRGQEHVDQSGDLVISSDTSERHSTIDISAPSYGSVVQDDQMTTSPADERILLVIEDDARFAQSLIKLGRQHDFKVLYASTGTEGVRLAEFYTPSAILLDIQLPILDGWGVLRHLKKNASTSHIPVHIISVVDDSQFGYRLGAAHYLTKPVEPEKLEDAFDRIESLLKREVRRLLIVEDNKTERESIIKLLQSDQGVDCTGVESGREALNALREQQFDTIILDLRLPDMTGNELLARITEDRQIEHTPVIVYTGKDLSIEEEKQLREFAESIVLKTAESPARLLEETSIFLHQVRSALSEEKQKLIAEISNVDAILKERTVLLVDDDIRNTFALSAVLENRGLNVLTAANGEEALSVLNENHATIDMVLMDVMMPIMDGYEATRRIRAQSRFGELPIIALTAKALREDRDLCIDAGASDYMAKPIDHDQLFSLIRVWMSTKR